jgi:hypothetical protein
LRIGIPRKLRMDFVDECCQLAQRAEERRKLDLCNESGLQLIIFSKDRAAQLHALLFSMKMNFNVLPKVYVVYSATGQIHNDTYSKLETLVMDFDIHWFHQNSKVEFKSILLHVLRSEDAQHVMFLVDDIIFTEPVHIDLFNCWADCESVPMLRMGLNINKSYMQDRYIPYPFPMVNHSLNVSKGKGGKGEQLVMWGVKPNSALWNYPLSLDGNIFQQQEILEILNRIQFDSPNSLEQNMQKFAYRFRDRIGVAYAKSRLVNIPLNRVQDDFTNKSMNLNADEIAGKWLNGLSIDINGVQHLWNNSPHFEFELVLSHDQ